MKRSIKNSLLVILLLFPFFALAETNFTTSTEFCFNGWGTVGVDGTYSYYGEAYGAHEYTNGTFYLDTSGNISNDYANVRGEPENYLTTYYYTYPAAEWISSAGPWSYSGSLGESPIGTATLGACAETPIESVSFGSTTVATSTLQLVGTTAVGFSILITISLIYLIAYLYNSMFKKKPWHNS